MDRRRRLGNHGEEAAARYLLSRGYDILARGWRIKGGEIDLVALQGDEVVFVEVKTRHPGAYGEPEEAVTAAKRVHLRRAAYAWLDAQPERHRRFRVDVIAVMIDPDGGRTRLRHIMNAVGEKG